MSEKNKAILEATLSVKDDLTGSLGIPVERIYPDLEDVTIKPLTEEQKLKSKMYGYNEITVEPVTSEIDEDIQPENIKAGTNILGVDGKETVVDTEDATVIAESILEGQTAYAKGEKINGSIETYDGSFEGISELPPDGLYLCRVVDYDGTIIKEAWLTPGSVFELPEPPIHERLVFQEWSSPVDIADNKVIAEDRDIFIGPIYKTASGATEIDIKLDFRTGLYVYLSGISSYFSQIDWGDGIVDDKTTTLLGQHTYSEYGEYTIKIYGMTHIFSTLVNQPVYYGVKCVHLSEGITNIRNGPCDNMRSLEGITMPADFTDMSEVGFEDCFHLKTLILPSKVTEVPYRIASFCYGLHTIVIPKGVLSVSESAFYESCNLEHITIPDTVTSIGKYAFQNVHKLKRLKLPKSVTELSPSTFYCANGLIELDLSEVTSTDLTYLCYQNYTLEKIIFPKNVIILTGATCYCYNLKEAEIPNTVTNIDSCFSNTWGIKRLIIPDGVTIMKNTISDCESLEEVKLPNYLTSMDGCIRDCHMLKEVKFPGTLTTMNSLCCYNCNSVTKYDFSEAQQVPVLAASSSFYNIHPIAKIIVPDELYDEWITATNWSKYADYICKKSEVVV